VSIILAIAGVTLASLTLNDMYEGNIAARTIWGVFAMAGGVSTLVVPLLVTLGRRRFLALRQSHQWLLTVIVPITFVVVLGALIMCGLNSSTVVIPYTPTLQIRYLQDGSLEFVLKHGARKGGGGSSSSGSSPNSHDTEFQFTAWGGGRLGENKKTIISLAGHIKRPADNSIEITADLELAEQVRLLIDGLTNVTITTDDQTSLPPVELESGRYALVITGNTQ
jgi:hypothetical protein